MLEKYLKRGTALVALGFAISLAAQGYYGWNLEPLSAKEANTMAFGNTIKTVGLMYFAFPILIAFRTCITIMDQVAKTQQTKKDEQKE